LAPPRQSRKMRFRLQAVSRSGDLVLRTEALSIGYHDEGRPLFQAPDLLLKRGECAAVIGPNGAGKTTFLKTLLEKIPPYSGEVRLGASLQIGYFAQAHEGLRSDNTLMEEINKVAPHMLPAETRDYLAKFLFTGDDVFKEVKLLSGGERGRLALACLALQGTNLLLLDEPTNHLDLPSQELLQALLADYQGTILLVSHDRYLIDALATQVWEVEPAQRALRVFDGTYSEYRAARQAEALQAAAEKAAILTNKTENTRPRGANNSANRKRKERIRVIETEIAMLESQIAAITRQLENPPTDAGKVVQLGRDYQNLQRSLEAQLSDWAELAEE
ncbi:MAG: ATP-binding cassette domain-containing protein, partial [Bellilinea sp.]